MSGMNQSIVGIRFIKPAFYVDIREVSRDGSVQRPGVTELYNLALLRPLLSARNESLKVVSKNREQSLLS